MDEPSRAGEQENKGRGGSGGGRASVGRDSELAFKKAEDSPENTIWLTIHLIYYALTSRHNSGSNTTAGYKGDEAAGVGEQAERVRVGGSVASSTVQ